MLDFRRRKSEEPGHEGARWSIIQSAISWLLLVTSRVTSALFLWMACGSLFARNLLKIRTNVVVHNGSYIAWINYPLGFWQSRVHRVWSLVNTHLPKREIVGQSCRPYLSYISLLVAVLLKRLGAGWITRVVDADMLLLSNNRGIYLTLVLVCLRKTPLDSTTIEDHSTLCSFVHLEAAWRFTVVF